MVKVKGTPSAIPLFGQAPVEARPKGWENVVLKIAEKLGIDFFTALTMYLKAKAEEIKERGPNLQGGATLDSRISKFITFPGGMKRKMDDKK